MCIDISDGQVSRLTERADALKAVADGALALLVSPKRVVVFDTVAGSALRQVEFADGPSAFLPRIALSSDHKTLAIGSG